MGDTKNYMGDIKEALTGATNNSMPQLSGAARFIENIGSSIEQTQEDIRLTRHCFDRHFKPIERAWVRPRLVKKR